MRELIDGLNSHGWDVQLQHSEEETTRDDHGTVRVLGGEGGVLLAESEGFQHNRNFSGRTEMMKELVGKVLTALLVEAANNITLQEEEAEKEEDNDGVAAVTKENGG